MALTRLAYEMVSSTQEVVANKTVGNIEPGQTIPPDTTLQEFIELMVTAVFAPSYVNPSVTLDSSISSPQEVGYEANLTLTATFNRGRINGVMTAGVWDGAAKQNDYAGASTKYTIDGHDNANSNSYNKGTVTIEAGNNAFPVVVDYAEGPQPLNSKNLAFEVDGITPLTKLAADTVSGSVTVVGQRKYFHGVDNEANSSATVRSLSASALNASNGTSFTINIPSGATSVVFAYPDSLRDVSTVKYVEGLNAEVKNIFTKTSVSVEGANGYTAIGYKVYRYVPAAPFPQSATYNVTI